MSHRYLLASIAVCWGLLIASHAFAQPTTITDNTPGGATVDGTVNGGEYVGSSSGINGSFGDVIGATSVIHVDSDDPGGNVFFGIVGGGGDLNDVAVIYIDSVTGGFADTTGFTDVADVGRQAISGTNGTSTNHLTFAAGFTADFAIAIDAASANLFDLESGGSHTFVQDAGINPASMAMAGAWELSILLSNIGLTNADSFQYIVTYVNPTTMVRADEFHGVDGTTVGAGNIAAGSNTMLAATDFNTFISTGCGNGVVEGTEACDDGNTVAMDGCAADCSAIEAGWGCPSAGGACTECVGGFANPCNGNGTCNQGADGDGTCMCDPGFAAPDCSDCEAGRFGATCAECPGGAATPCSDQGTCDEGIGGAGTCMCDMGWTGADCSMDIDECMDMTDNCHPNATCSNMPPGSFTCTCDPGFNGDGVTACDPICGDGMTVAGEDCDDSGESSMCNIDCTNHACQDGKVNFAAGESCDDNNIMNGDGCSDTCQVEAGFTCTGFDPSACSASCGTDYALDTDPGLQWRTVLDLGNEVFEYEPSSTFFGGANGFEIHENPFVFTGSYIRTQVAIPSLADSPAVQIEVDYQLLGDDDGTDCVNVYVSASMTPGTSVASGCNDTGGTTTLTADLSGLASTLR